MSSDLYPAGIPRFNHVAMSVSADLLDVDGRAALVDFHQQVYGFTELTEMTVDRERLVLSCCDYQQFIFLIVEDTPMVAPRLDHYGLSVSSKADFDACYERARVAAAADPRVDLIAPKFDDFEVLKLHSFYVGFLLPLMIEIQYWEFT